MVYVPIFYEHCPTGRDMSLFSGGVIGKLARGNFKLVKSFEPHHDTCQVPRE
ncbi:hypothetical protein CCACVL1_00690, partial [Corchorus capsularis]